MGEKWWGNGGKWWRNGGHPHGEMVEEMVEEWNGGTWNGGGMVDTHMVENGEHPQIVG